MKAVLGIAAWVTILLIITGFAYELGYEGTLKLSAFALSWHHYLLSGLLNVAPPFVIAVGFSLLGKFFTRRVERDDAKELAWSLGQTTFVKQIAFARAGFLFALGFLVLELSGLHLPFSSEDPGLIYWYMLWAVAQLFLGVLLLSPAHARLAVLFAMTLSLCFCSTAGGVYSARMMQGKTVAVRDDAVAHVEMQNGAWVLVPKDINFLAELLALVAKV